MPRAPLALVLVGARAAAATELLAPARRLGSSSLVPSVAIVFVSTTTPAQGSCSAVGVLCALRGAWVL